MASEIHRIRSIRPDEFEQVRHLSPSTWGTDLPGFLTLHHGQPYFKGWVVEEGGGIIAFGNSLRNGNSGWLGNILVAPEARGRGIGAAITRHLMDDLHRQGCCRLLLVATPLGEPVYTRLGFRVTGRYAFYSFDSAPAVARHPAVRPLLPEDHPAALALDRRVTGETRTAFLSRFLDGGWVFDDGGGRAGIAGIHLPALATGLVIASDVEAGLALLRWRLSRGECKCVVPEQNERARRCLEELGGELTATAPRMALGREAAWRPAEVYQRAAGWCG
ncbi:MAG: GNAT family N-acetyltransferase [Anaerolineae bacterium]|nr:GNAT family N-acetyltransferase [Anaerolineae bacterium]